MTRPLPLLSMTLALALMTAPTAFADPCGELREMADRITDMRDSDPAAGVDEGERVLAGLADRECVVEQALLTGAVGSNLNILGRNEEAARRFEAALEAGGDRLDDASLALLHRGAGLAHHDIENFEAALRHNIESLRASERAGDTLEAAKTAGNIGILYNSLGELERSQEYHERSLAGFEQADWKPGIAGASINLGALAAKFAARAEQEGDPDEARRMNESLRDYNQRALELFNELGNRRGISYAASNVGLAHDRLGDPERGVEYHRRALEARRDIGDTRGTVNSLVSMAASLTQLQRYDEAEAHLIEAEGLLPDDNLLLWISVLEPWISLEEARGDLDAALRRQREIMQYRIELAESDYRTQVAEIGAQHEFEIQRRRITELEYESELAAQRIERERHLRYAAFAIMVLLFALGTALFARYRLKVSTQQALEKAAREDPLTGLANRRHMRELIDYEIARTRRSATPFSLAVLDIDDFKRINDEHGHATGDEVLVGIAERINALLRRQDTLARWGGDEMLLLLPETGEDGAVCLGRKLIELFGREPVHAGDRDFDITLTVGVSQYWPGMDLDDCLKQADEAMYAGKRAGKRQVVRGTRK